MRRSSVRFRQATPPKPPGQQGQFMWQHAPLVGGVGLSRSLYLLHKAPCPLRERVHGVGRRPRRLRGRLLGGERVRPLQRVLRAARNAPPRRRRLRPTERLPAGLEVGQSFMCFLFFVPEAVRDRTQLLVGSGQPRGIEDPEPGRDEDPGDDPEADHDGDLVPSQVFEVMMNGSDSEDATPRARESLGQLEADHLQ
jgi:hypothetical protein